jgi:chromosome segregation ATPase
MEQRVENLEQRVNGLESHVNKIETRLAVAESNIKEIFKKLDSIDNNTTWILRLILGALILSIIGLVIKGGI